MNIFIRIFKRIYETFKYPKNGFLKGEIAKRRYVIYWRNGNPAIVSKNETIFEIREGKWELLQTAGRLPFAYIVGSYIGDYDKCKQK